MLSILCITPQIWGKNERTEDDIPVRHLRDALREASAIWKLLPEAGKEMGVFADAIQEKAQTHIKGEAMTYDKACLELAQHFLDDCSIPGDVRAKVEVRLAIVIQHAVEDFIQDAVPETDRP